jgi:hypothetical protein
MKFFTVLAVLSVILLVGGVGAADPVNFYWVYRVFAAKDAECTGISTESHYQTNLNFGKYYGGDGTNSECIKVSEILRYYKIWCDSSTGTVGVQEFIKSDCTDAKYFANPAIAGERGGKNVFWTVKGECYYEPKYGVSVKSEGCFVEQSKVPSGYTQYSRANRARTPWFIAMLLSLSSFLFICGRWM